MRKMERTNKISFCANFQKYIEIQFQFCGYKVTFVRVTTEVSHGEQNVMYWNIPMCCWLGHVLSENEFEAEAILTIKCSDVKKSTSIFGSRMNWGLKHIKADLSTIARHCMYVVISLFLHKIKGKAVCTVYTDRCFFVDFVKLEVKMDIEMYPPVHYEIAECYLKLLVIK